MTTPLLPDTAGASTFGGNEFVDEDAVVDAETEVSATYFNRITSQLAASSYTQPRAWAYVTVAATVPTLAEHGAVWGDSPAVAPVVARSSAGVFTLTWPTSVDDLQAVAESHSTNIRAVTGQSHNAASALVPRWDITSANVLTVTFHNLSAAATDPASFSVAWT